ncbi:MAG: amidohydrolase [Flavobacteriales bacterium]|nr:amidohydrolase [Flavobacteriales bacterium]
MNITLIQAELYWEDRASNLKMLDSQLEQLKRTDIVVLPEMFTTAFSTQSKDLAEKMDGHTVAWMKAHASHLQAVLAGSVIIEEEGRYYNRFLWVTPEGDVTHYDKRHLFRMAGEHDHFSPGRDRVIVKWKDWRIMLQVCYDLRFPVFSRNRYHGGDYEYDLIIYVANWPRPRHNAWRGLLQARAMENLAYSAGVNRIGSDANGLEYAGGSVIYDYLGKHLAQGQEDMCILQADLDREALLRFREKFPTGMDADQFELKV